jgi:hypothetical protein
MQIPDYATLRRRAGTAQAHELKRLTLIAVRAIRRAFRSLEYRWNAAMQPARALKPVPVRRRQ